MTTNATLSANWSPLEHAPSDEVLQRLLDSAERRWSSERFGGDSDVRVITDWIWDFAPRDDEVEVVRVIEAANSVAYSLGRKRPVVLFPHGAHPTVDFFVAPVDPDLPGGIM